MFWIQAVVPAVGEIAENSVEQEIAVNRRFPEEEWGMPQRDVEARQEPVRLGPNGCGVAPPLLHATPAKLALLVPQVEAARDRVGDAVVHNGIEEAEGLELDVVAEELDDNRLESVEPRGKESKHPAKFLSM